jgi:hypothetical protein
MEVENAANPSQPTKKPWIILSLKTIFVGFLGFFFVESAASADALSGGQLQAWHQQATARSPPS